MDMTKFDTALNRSIWACIPQEIIDRAPEPKKDEFRRGVIMYLQREKGSVYGELEAAGTVPAERQGEITGYIEEFFAMLKAKKGIK